MEAMDNEKIGLPMTPDQITSEWLTQVLATRYPGIVVSSTQIAQIIWGTATKVCLLLDYDAAGKEENNVG